MRMENLSRTFLISWLNGLGVSTSRIEEIGKGVILCKLLSDIDSGFPRYNQRPCNEAEYLSNLVLAKNYLESKGKRFYFPADRMCKLRLQDNLEAIKWFYGYYEEALTARNRENMTERKNSNRDGNSARDIANREDDNTTGFTHAVRTVYDAQGVFGVDNLGDSGLMETDAPQSASGGEFNVELSRQDKQACKQMAGCHLGSEGCSLDSFLCEEQQQVSWNRNTGDSKNRIAGADCAVQGSDTAIRCVENLSGLSLRDDETLLLESIGSGVAAPDTTTNESSKGEVKTESNGVRNGAETMSSKIGSIVGNTKASGIRGTDSNSNEQLIEKYARIFENERDFYFDKLVSIEKYILTDQLVCRETREAILDILYDRSGIEEEGHTDL